MNITLIPVIAAAITTSGTETPAAIAAMYNSVKQECKMKN